MAARKKKQEKQVEAPPVTLPVVASPTTLFNKVESNIKGGVRMGLGPCTAIVSDHNRAGKTSVLDSFRLALTGSHPIGPHAADLVGLTADASLPWAKLTGTTAEAHLWHEGGRKTPSHTLGGALADVKDPAQLLPLVAMRDLLTLGTAKAREELFRRFGGASEVEIPPGLSESQQVLWQQALSSGQGDVVERLSAAGTWLRSHKRTLSAKAKALDEERKRLAGSTAPVTDDVVRDLESRLDDVLKYKQAEGLRGAFKQANEALMMVIIQYEASSTPLTDEQLAQAEQETRIKLLPPQWDVDLTTARQNLEAAKANARMYAVINNLRERLASEGCLACGGQVHGDVGPLVAASKRLLDDEMGNVQTVTQAVADLEAKIKVAQANVGLAIAALRHNNNESNTARQQILYALKVRKEEYERLEKLVNEQGGAEAPLDGEAQLRAQLADCQKAKLDAERLLGLSGELRALKLEQHDVKAVEEVVGDVLSRLVSGVKTAAEEAVNRWMPESFHAVLVLEDSDSKPTCRWEIVGRDSQPHRKGAASGAEWSALTVAIACAWTEGQPYRFLLLDDSDIAGFSASNIKRLLDTVSAAVREGRLTQALVAWSRPAEIPDEGWTVVAL